jgi:hypothetical protein
VRIRKDGNRPPEPVVRRSGRIPDAIEYSGLCRTALYDLSKQHVGLFKKYGAATIVDFSVLDAIIESLPPK